MGLKPYQGNFAAAASARAWPLLLVGASAATSDAVRFPVAHCVGMEVPPAVHPARAPQARVERLIGAACKRARFLPGLRCDGIGEAAQARLTWPIGMPGSDGKAPEAIAVAMVAWLLLGAVAYAAQRAGSGRPSGHAPPPGASRAVAR
ncbi:XdhC family protein [Xanthomonas translucens pv. poae]|uniref:XdhC family protein n=1 Tax=Xanthomonas graminis TaxID=3390026 RepID=UPI00164056A4|nr:XdhC family protein [Xanthomonas translucens]UKE61202.1 XdhC family protein [Xanthomonas translucens pv. poae]